MGRPPGPSPADLRAMPSQRPAIVLYAALALCGDSHPDSSCADGSWADVNDASRFGLSRARRDACGVRRIESDDEPSTWEIRPCSAGRFSSVKYSQHRVGTANRASGSLAPPIRIAHTPGVERGNELAHAAHDLPRPSAATKASSKVVLRNGHFWAVLQPFHQVAQTQVPNQC